MIFIKGKQSYNFTLKKSKLKYEIFTSERFRGCVSIRNIGSICCITFIISENKQSFRLKLYIKKSDGVGYRNLYLQLREFYSFEKSMLCSQEFRDICNPHLTLSLHLHLGFINYGSNT